ncbi:MAG TPA: sulfatase-like hydrolase/transferase [Thermoanaerobaculia bacterium]|nr:sulfatase-like hydrolase/transferase [Thermoanaerobaculia bacterium]
MMSRPKVRWLGPAAGLLLAVLVVVGALYARRVVPAAEKPQAAAPSGAAGKPDIVLVTIDTLRADAPGFAGNSRVSTPTLDRLAKQGRVFTSAHAHNVVTLPSHANILTGLYPYQHGVRENGGFRLSSDVPTLATLLRARGYATGAFVGGFPLDSRFGLNRDFDVYDDRYPKGGSGLEFEISERPAAAVIAAAEKWYADNGGKPRFLWVHLYDCHAPYRPPGALAEQYKKDPYLGEVAGVDAALDPLLTPYLDGKMRRALLILTADHGESLGEHDEDTHSLFGYEATLKVPLVVWSRDLVAPGIDSRPARHVDIAPTIAAAAGIPRPSPWPGSSLLLPPVRAPEDASYFEAFSAAYNYGWAPLRGVVEGGYKFVDLPLPELYDLKADPGERHNLISENPEEAGRLRRLIPGESAFGAAPRSKPDTESVARLRSLGYLSGSATVKASYSASDDPKRLVAINREFGKCIELYQQGDLRGATELARRVVQERPTMVLAYVHLAFLLRRSGDSPGALAVYRAAAARGIANEELIKNYGLALCEAGRPAEAVKFLEPFSGTSDSGTRNALGIALADAGRGPEAEKVFEGVLALDPENVEAQENMGIVRLRAEDLPGARDCFRKILAIDAGAPRAWNGLGVALARLGDERGAIDSWSRAVALDPTMYDALFNLGLTAAKVGLREQARLALERFVSAAPPARYGADIEKARGILRSLGVG